MSVECTPAQTQAISNPDRFAWDVICNWSSHTTVNLIYNGIDYAELTRCFLWDKVARSVRQRINPAQFEFEQAILERRSPPQSFVPHPNRLKVWLKRSLRSFQSWQDARSRPPKTLYVPCFHPTLQTIVREAASAMGVVVPSGVFPEIPYLRRFRPPLSDDCPFAPVEVVYRGILEGLNAFEIELLPSDATLLKSQITQLFLRTQQIEQELTILRPSAILLFADNHFPVQSYVLVARQLGIPTIMLQHGLDCEHFCLDQAYADVISVWGSARLQRYQRASTWQPKRIQVNGNPDYDRFTLPEHLDLNGDYWLWATRPHAPEKCLSPSRIPQEAGQILATLLTALEQAPDARLVIKPHPLEELALYRSHLSDRVQIVTNPVGELLPNASLVISEDSTVGLEAMCFGKVVIHTHFADSTPVLPYVEYGAALSGYSPELLRTALETAAQLTASQQQTLLEGQRRFLQEFGGIGTGSARDQVLSLIQSVLNS